MTKKQLLFLLGGLGVVHFSYRKWQENQFSFKGKTVVLTGGSRGLGLVMARQMIAEGARVVSLARDPETLRRAEQEFPPGSYFPIQCDVTEASDLERAHSIIRAKFNSVDVLIHNAGIIQVGPFHNLNKSDYEDSLKLHFWATYQLIRNFLPQLKRSKDARVLVTNSLGGRVGVPHLSSYSVGKFAQSGFLESIRPELVQSGIGLTVAYPALMRTGSPDHAHYRGNLRDERFWFTLSDSLPLISLPADQAVTSILNAVKAGRPEVIPGFVGKLGLKTRELSPSLFNFVMKVANGFLPKPLIGLKTGAGQQGLELPPDPRLKKAAYLTHIAARENNEL